MARDAPLAGRRLGSYTIGERIGAGGMGVVYRARDERLGREVAIKVLQVSEDSGEDAARLLMREARAAARLNHPGICTIYEVGEADGQSYIVMELIDGDPMSVRLARGPLPAAEAMRYGVQLVEALEHAHERHLVHRDFKSANVIVTQDGRAKVLDFGLAKRVRSDGVDTTTESVLTAPGTVAGTLAYMAPELLRGQPADARSDIWAVGVVLHEMVAGLRPFSGTTAFELSSAILNQPPGPLPAHTPSDLRAVILRCLDKDPGRRYQRAGELRAGLEGVREAARATPAWTRRPAIALALLTAAALAVALGLDVGGIRGRLSGASRGARIRSLAVLPLESASGDAGQGYFADGVTDEIIAGLSKIGALKVVSRTSSARYRKSDKSLPQIARELGVDGVLEGSLLRDGNRVRVTVQLIDGRDDRNLWGETYQREVRDILALTSGVAQAVARELSVKLTPQEQARLDAARPVRPEAFDEYLKGRASWDAVTPEGYRAAQEHFDRALALDPDYALAHAGIALNWMAQEHIGFVSPTDAYPKMRAAAEKAVALDGTLADAHIALATVRFYADWDWAGASAEFARANARSDQCSSWRITYLDSLLVAKRFDEAIAESRRCLDRDPLNPFYRQELAMALSWARRYDESIAAFRALLADEPDYFLGHLNLWASLHYKTRAEEAWAEARRAFDLLGDRELARALAPAGSSGYPGAMRRAAAVLAERSRQTYVPNWLVAQFFNYGGDVDQALDWLERAYVIRESGMVYLDVLPDYDTLRGDARFQSMLARMKFGP